MQRPIRRTRRRPRQRATPALVDTLHCRTDHRPAVGANTPVSHTAAQLLEGAARRASCAGCSRTRRKPV